MNLFHPRVIKKALEHIDLSISEDHTAILNAWGESIASRAILKQKETALHGHFIQKILIEVLGYTGFGTTAAWDLQREQQIGKGSVDVALGHFTEKGAQIIAPFELKGAKTKDLDAIMPGRHKSSVQQAWEYAMDAPGAKWVLVSNYLELRLYAVGYGRQVYEVWKLDQLSDPKEYAKFLLLLSMENLLGTRTRDLLQESEKTDKEITNQLYREFKTLREKLITTLKEDNPHIELLDIIRYAQTILDRILFIAFAEDNPPLLPKHTLDQAYQHRDPYNPKPIWDNFKGLFRGINEGNDALGIPAYDGGLFRADALPEDLRVCDNVCEAFKELGEYDFNTEVSVTILGHIFEQSITDIETLQADAKGETPATVGKRKKEGVVYTPDSITRFIVEKTLGGYLSEKFEALWEASADQRNKSGKHAGKWKAKKDEIAFWREYQEILRKIKVVDPACGSGAFLVAAFEYLSDEYMRVIEKLRELTGGSYGLFDLNKEILNQNVYGVDINAESIEITKLSLWLKTARYGKVLTSLDHTLRVGDSLIEEFNISHRAFRWKEAFPGVFEQGGFDVVLGNPPYVRQEFISHLKPYLQKQYTIYNGVADLYTYFFERGLRLLKPGGKLGYISSSTFFKTGSGQNLRKYLSENATIEDIVDFGDLQVFEGVTTYPTILIIANVKPKEQHALKFLKLENELENDLIKEFNTNIATMPQASLMEESWRLEDEKPSQLRGKIMAEKKTLKEVYGSPYRGILTGLNEAFVINRKTQDNLIAKDSKSEEIIKPFMEGKDLQKWRSEPRDLWLILFPRGWTIEHIGIKSETEAWLWLKEQYPAIVEHLEPFVLRARKRLDKGDFWWELRACAYYEEFKKPKIIYPEISQGSKFSLDFSGIHTNKTVFILPTTDWFLLGLLNSKATWFHLFGECTALRGGIWRLNLQSIYINNIPIPEATDVQKATIADLARRCQETAEARYQIQESIRRRIPDLCPAGREPKLNTKLKAWWTLDFTAFRKEAKKCFKTDIPLAERNDWESYLSAERTKIEEFSHTLEGLEADLNQQVYTLFDLTEEEIVLIEQEIHR